jgi:methionyl-tRNA synthetase
VIPEATARIWAQLGLGDISKFQLSELKWGQLPLSIKVGKVEAVFPRADKSLVEKMQKMEDERRASLSDRDKRPPEKVGAEIAEQAAAAAGSPKGAPLPVGAGAQAGQRATQAAASSPPATATVPVDAAKAPSPAVADGKIAIDDFVKVELRVGQVKVAEKVKNADKLLRLEVDIGTEVRQIVAGIAEAYTPESLIGRKVVIVANLAPRKLRGIESNGMIVAASVGEKGMPVLAGFLEDVPVGAKLK